MKIKRLIMSMMAVVLLAVTTGCTDEYYIYQNLTQTHEYTITADQWRTDAGSNYYYAAFNNADITADVERYGSVVAYVYDQGLWNPLPYVYPYYSATEDKTWAENIRFDWTTGMVRFIVQDLDGGLPENMGTFPTLTIKVNVLL